MNRGNGAGLPPPSPAELEHSEKLVRSIRKVIDEGPGWIEFSRFMELALYSPAGGYYVSGLRKFGAEGDFVTAPELGRLFGRCLTRQITQVLDQLGPAGILEVGAGSGVLSAQIIEALHEGGGPVPRYGILELSPDLQQRQRGLLQERVPQYLDRVYWLTEMPVDFSGVVLANELLDALPVDRFVIRGDRLRGLGVGWGPDGFEDVEYEAEHGNWDPVRRLGLAEGYTSEVGFQAQGWMRTVAGCLRRGAVIIVDYGYPAREYFHPQRDRGTLMCHYRHRGHTDPYINVGLQDITAHVDFTALARCAQESGLSLLGFTTQASFLLSLGILEIVGPLTGGSAVETAKISQQVKKLTMPSEMGELFKVMVVGTGLDEPLLGFNHTDHRGRL